jgi:hypothetical protein
MAVETQTQTREKTRVFITGNCEGLTELSDALGRHSELDLVGMTEQVREGAGALTGGHLQAVLHATRSSALPVDEIASIRQYTQASCSPRVRPRPCSRRRSTPTWPTSSCSRS